MDCEVAMEASLQECVAAHLVSGILPAIFTFTTCNLKVSDMACMIACQGQHDFTSKHPTSQRILTPSSAALTCAKPLAKLTTSPNSRTRLPIKRPIWVSEG